MILNPIVSSARTRDGQKAAETEEEELRRLERNRVAFEAWLQRKNEERKVATVIMSLVLGFAYALYMHLYFKVN